jgi:hypothetical protein
LSKSGRGRAITRYASPSFRTNAPGEWPAFFAANMLSFPRGDVSVMTFTLARADFSAS